MHVIVSLVIVDFSNNEHSEFQFI